MRNSEQGTNFCTEIIFMKDQTSISTSNITSFATSEGGVTYLLTEFQQCIAQKQHIDDRMDKEVQYYFTLLGALVASIGLISQFSTNLQMLLVSIHLFLFVMLASGVRLYRRISYLNMLGALMAAQTNLIRAFFVEREQHLRYFTILTVASSHGSAHDYLQLRKHGSIRNLKTLNTIALFIIIVTIPLHAYLVNHTVITIAWWLLVLVTSLVLAIIGSVALFYYQDKMIKNGGEAFLDHITKTVQNKVKERSDYELIIKMLNSSVLNDNLTPVSDNN